MKKAAILFGVLGLGVTWLDDSVLASPSKYKETWSAYYPRSVYKHNSRHCVVLHKAISTTQPA